MAVINTASRNWLAMVAVSAARLIGKVYWSQTVEYKAKIAGYPSVQTRPLSVIFLTTGTTRGAGGKQLLRDIQKPHITVH
jgi:hypothetical protein